MEIFNIPFLQRTRQVVTSLSGEDFFVFARKLPVSFEGNPYTNMAIKESDLLAALTVNERAYIDAQDAATLILAEAYANMLFANVPSANNLTQTLAIGNVMAAADRILSAGASPAQLSLTAALGAYLAGDNSGNLYFNSRPAYNEVAHNIQNIFTGPLNVFQSNITASYATTSTVPYFDASKNLISSVVTSIELGYLGGVLSPIQTQINNIVLGLSWKTAANVLCTTDITVASPGATLDGVTMSAGFRVVLNGQSTGSENGIYTWNGAAVPMTRTSDANTGTNILQATLVILSGTSANNIYTCPTPAPITIGVTTISFVQIGATTYVGTAGRISLVGNVFDIDVAYIGQTSIKTLGPVSTGSWNADIITGAFGGSGVNNGVRTISYAGNVAFSGAFGTTFTVTAPTTVTLPTSGTLATLAGTETLTNKAVVKRVVVTTQSATPSIKTDAGDVFTITGLAQAITSFVMSGTPTNWQMIVISVTDNGTGRLMTPGASFENSLVSFPATTVANTEISILCRWNPVTSKWRVIGIA